MKTRIDTEIEHSLIVDKDGLRAIQNFIFKQYKHTEFTAKCVDGSILETDNIEEIISFSNPNFRHITQIVFEAQNDPSEGLTLEMESQSGFFGEPISLDVRSESDEKAVFVVKEIRDLLKEMKPWYDLLARTPIWMVCLCIGIALCVMITILRFMGRIPFYPGTASLLSMITLGVSGLVVIGLLDYVKASLFPIIFFEIGKQKRKMERIKFWHKLLFGSIGLALLISILGNILSRAL
ncbi:MAG: hypothetical protein OXU23_15295 [Candidatus Poribacteria bacterium]|nr:hypothetical protein [Candidatus Poribacteria bacterium]